MSKIFITALRRGFIYDKTKQLKPKTRVILLTYRVYWYKMFIT